MDGNALSIRSSQLLNKGIPPWELGTENLVIQSPYVCGGEGGGRKNSGTRQQSSVRRSNDWSDLLPLL